MRPLMGPDDPEPRAEPLAAPVAPLWHADTGTAQRRFDPLRGARERRYRHILTDARTSRALVPMPVA
ncbi:hypothetical protein [Nocardia sp. NPDC052112]|uniref:hypothetical protein n=1 Tax=Nocardia sp. NPDC052112 TaxID=3155646 RepID=UPI0034175084